MLNAMYVLITVANAAYGVTISQQEYYSKQKCEAAAIVTQEAAKNWAHRIQTRCVEK